MYMPHFLYPFIKLEFKFASFFVTSFKWNHGICIILCLPFWILLFNVLFFNLYIVDELVGNYMYFKYFFHSCIFTLLIVIFGKHIILSLKVLKFIYILLCSIKNLDFDLTL